jgi:hypothetical protein
VSAREGGYLPEWFQPTSRTIWKPATQSTWPGFLLGSLSRRRLVGDLPRTRAATRPEPVFEIVFGDANATLRYLNRRRAFADGEHSFEGPPDDTGPHCGLVETENLHLCVLFVLGRTLVPRRKFGRLILQIPPPKILAGFSGGIFGLLTS